MSNQEILYGIGAIIFQYLSGSVMYSAIIAKKIGIDLRGVTDGNPGASNLWRAAGWKPGITALVLDFLKGIFPLEIFISSGMVDNEYIIAIAALAGIAGHAFPPMLRFRGGKAIATTFGAWTLLTAWEAPVLLGTIFTIFSLTKPRSNRYNDAVRYMLGLFALFVYVLLKSIFAKERNLLLLFGGTFLIAIYKHRKELKKLLFNKNDIADYR